MTSKPDYYGVPEAPRRTSSELKWLSMQDFEFGTFLGKGAFGSVCLVRHKRTHYPYAIKILFKSHIVDSEAEKHIANEIELQGRLDHPHIAKMKSWWQTSDKLFFLFEYCHWKTLFDVIREERRLREKYALKLFSQVVSAVDFCHKHNIIHRDIKPENILLWRRDHAKLSDFGWSACSTPGVKNITICGTLEYMAPELVTEMGHDYRVDNWALGILLYEMVHGSSPFASDDDKECKKNIIRGTLRFYTEVSHFVKDIVIGLTHRIPSKRMETKDIIRILEENK
uniref:Aurora kinase n=1 Tax=Strongyloides papillosus TaxID=174720 RepID=A0A0N5BAS2_STREA